MAARADPQRVKALLLASLKAIFVQMSTLPVVGRSVAIPMKTGVSVLQPSELYKKLVVAQTPEFRLRLIESSRHAGLCAPFS